MRWIILLTLVLFGCGNANIIDEPIVDEPVNLSVEVEPTPTETVVEEVIETPPEEPTEIETPPEDPIETEPEIPDIDPHSDPHILVETYQRYIGEALNGHDSRYEDAYELISSWAKRTSGWASNIENYKQFADVQLNKYGNTGTIYEFKRSEKFGIGYRVYYESSEGEIYYYVHIEDDLLYISSCSMKGCVYWTTE